MTQDEYQSALVEVYFMVKRLADLDVPKMLANIDCAESVGPIIDPTLWRDKAQAMREDKLVLEAAIKLREIGLKMRKREETANVR